MCEEKSVGASEQPFAVEVSFTAREVACVVSVSIKLENEKRRISNFTEKVLHEGIGTALEVAEMDDVDVFVFTGKTARFQNTPPRVPEHVGMKIVGGMIVEGKKIERQDIDSIEITEFARDIAIPAAIVNVVGAANEKNHRLSRSTQSGTSLMTFLNDALVERSIARRGRHPRPDRFGGA